MALRVNTPSCIHSTHPHLLPYMPQPSPIVPVSVDRSRTSPLALRSPPGIANSQTRRSLKRNRDDGHHTTTTEAKSLNESEPHDSTRQPPHGATREPPRKAHAPTHATKQWTWFRNLSRHQMAHIGSAQVDWANKVGHIRAMKWRQFIADEESVALINRLYQQYRAFTDPTPETNDSACTTEAGSHTRASMPSEHDTQLANETRPLLPAPASATMAASTAATSLGDDKGFCQLWLALARQELQLPASWAVQISESWNQVSTDLNAVTEPTPSGNSHHTTVRCRRRHDPTDRVDLLPTAKRVYSQFIFHASKLLLLHRNQYGLQSVRRKGRHDPLKNNYYEKNYNSEALFKNHLAKAFKGFFDRADNRNSKSCLWAEWKLTEAGEALSPLSPDQLATLQSILSDLPVDQSMATTNLATASEPGVAFLALARVAAETSRAITRNTRQGQAAQGSTLDTRATKRVHFQPAARAEHIGEPIQTEMSNPDPGPASVPELGPSPGSRRARAPEPRSRQRKRGPGNTLRLTHPPGINLDAPQRLTTLQDTAHDNHNNSMDFEISASTANNSSEDRGDDNVPNSNESMSDSERSDSSTGSVSESDSDHDEPSDIPDVKETSSFPRDMRDVPSLHLLLQPVPEETRPQPSRFENPPEWRTSPPFTAGGLHLPDGRTAAAKWQKRIGPSLSKMVKNWIERGYQIRPQQFAPIEVPNRPLSQTGQRAQDVEMEAAIRSGVIREYDPAETPAGFSTWTHCISQVPKKHTTETRTVYEMVEGNKYLKSWKVRHEGPRQIRLIARPNDFAAMVDLRKGYWQINCGPPWLLQLRARVKRSWLEHKASTSDEPWADVLLAWVVLVMGMKLAGAVFQKVVKQLLGRWRRLGFRLANILDDTLFMDQSAERLRTEIIPTVVDDCQHLNVQINYGKSTLVPVQRLEWFGILWCFDTNTAHIPSEKIDRTIDLMNEASTHPERFTPRVAARVAGTLMAMSPAIACTKCMTTDCYRATRKPKRDSPRRSHWDSNIPLPVAVQAELKFWIQFLLSLNQQGRNIFASNRTPDLTIRGDGSQYGYGGMATDKHGKRHGLMFDKWSDAETAFMSKNQYLAELLTLLKLVQANVTGQALEWTNTTIHAHVQEPFTADQLARAMHRPDASQGFHTLHFEGDNEAVMHRITNAKGSNESAGRIAKLILFTLMASGSTLSISTVGGQAMVSSGVDAASRRKWAHPSQWHIKPQSWNNIVAWTRRQFQSPHTRTVSMMPSTSATALQDATQPNYRQTDILICMPQPSLVNAFAAFLQEFALRGTLILPAWPSMALPLVLQHTMAGSRVGNAHDIFTSSGGDVPSWPYAAFAFDFARAPTHARLHSDWAYVNAVYFPAAPDGPAPRRPPDLRALVRTSPPVPGPPAAQASTQVRPVPVAQIPVGDVVGEATSSGTHQPPTVPTTGPQFSSDAISDGPRTRACPSSTSPGSSNDHDSSPPPSTTTLFRMAPESAPEERTARQPPQIPSTGAQFSSDTDGDGPHVDEPTSEAEPPPSPSAPPSHTTSPRIITVANVGGPCGGKSSGLPLVAARLHALGWTVVVCPETATAIFSAATGVMPTLSALDAGNSVTRLQSIMLQMQMQLEDQFKNVLRLCYDNAPASQGAILLCDRGSLCGKAFCSATQWKSALVASQTSDRALLKRYDLVVQWQSVAVDLADHYEFGAGSNNEQRWHSAPQAAAADAQSLRAWAAHPHFALVANRCNFARKCTTVARIVAAHGWHDHAVRLTSSDPWSAAACDGRAAALRTNLRSCNVSWHPPINVIWHPPPAAGSAVESAVDPASRPPITLFITTPARSDAGARQQPRWFAVNVPGLHSRVAAVSVQIERHANIPQRSQRLHYRGRQLTLESKLHDYGLQNGANLHLHGSENRPTGGKNEVDDRKHSDNSNADGPQQRRAPHAPWICTPSSARLECPRRPSPPRRPQRIAPWSITPANSDYAGAQRTDTAAQSDMTARTAAPPVPNGKRRQQDTRPQWWALLPNSPDTSWITIRKRLHFTADRAALEQRADTLLSASLEESTRRGYLPWWHRFASFCCDANMAWAVDPHHVPLPVDSHILRMYIAYLAPCYAASSIENALAAIAAVCRSHDVPGPATDPSVYRTLEGAKRMGPVTRQSNEIVEPDHIRKILELAHVDKWSHLRLLRAKAMIVWTFVIILRHCETRQMDLCDVAQVAEGSVATVRKAKNDAIGRGAATMFGHGTPWAARAEQSLYDWVAAARLQRSPQCTKHADPRSHCEACGYLFRRLRTCKGSTSVTQHPVGRSTLTDELRHVYEQLVRNNALPDTFDTKRRAIDLRRGGHTAMASKDIKSLRRAAHGRWKNAATAGDNYTFLHRSLMMQNSSVMLD